MKNSHGFFSNFFNASRIFDLAKKINNFLDSQTIIDNYYSDLNLFIPEVQSIIDQNLIKEVGKLISTNNPKLCNVELHVQMPFCKSIPPHQDNFYHCISPSRFGIKLLVPLSPLNEKNGGLSFLNIPFDYPIVDHIPSNFPNFSSVINPNVSSVSV